MDSGHLTLAQLQHIILTLTAVLPVFPTKRRITLPPTPAVCTLHTMVFSLQKRSQVDELAYSSAVTIGHRFFKSRSLDWKWSAVSPTSSHYATRSTDTFSAAAGGVPDLMSQSGTKYHSVPTRQRSHIIRKESGTSSAWSCKD